MNANPSKLIAAVSLCAVFISSNIASAAAISGQGTWETTLQGRDLDGDLATFEAYYDTAQNITWLANADYSLVSGSGHTAGLMSWSEANNWAASVNINGYTGWRLPRIIDTDGPDADTFGNDGCNQFQPGSTVSDYSGSDCGYNVDTSSGEMAYLYYVTLGNLSFFDTSGNTQPGYGMTNTGPFSNVRSTYYWSNALYQSPASGLAWFFQTDHGWQYLQDKTSSFYAWAVHDGDVGASVVPVPAAAWLFGSGLIGLISVARRKPA